MSEADRAARIEILDSLSDAALALGDAARQFESGVWNAAMSGVGVGATVRSEADELVKQRGVVQCVR